MRLIELSLGRTGWLADFKGDQEIQTLFGTTKIPTPFTVAAPAAKVLAAIQRKNPDCQVILI